MKLPLPPDVDLTRPTRELCAEFRVSHPIVSRWRREAGVVVPRGAPPALDIPRTRMLLLRLAGVPIGPHGEGARHLRTNERKALCALLGVSRQRINAAWETGVTGATLERWAALAR